MKLSTEQSTYAFSSWAFQRLIGVAYLFAFGSLCFQITGLVGHNGILPIDAIGSYMPKSQIGFKEIGLLAWLGTSDRTLQLLCVSGTAAAFFAIAGVATPLMFAFCWLFWLTVVMVGNEFLSFQWDILLLEAGLLTIFMAPWKLMDFPLLKIFSIGVSPVQMQAPPMVSVLLFRWLLFRLMFESGLCKIFSGDETWRDLTAMTYHYHTQPLPSPPAWLCDKLPTAILKGSTFFTLAIELICPFFIAIKKLRTVGAIILMLLQLCIGLTGNYAYFNLLTFAMCLFLIDDSQWQKCVVRLSKSAKSSAGLSGFAFSRAVRPHTVIAAVTGGAIFVISLGVFFQRMMPMPGGVLDAMSFARSLYIANSYGLFATMTTERDEILLEGSADGVSWKAYEFKYKPGDLSVPPCVVAPCQPRLDWQMWFASLGDLSSSPWFAHFVVKILQNSPEVLALLKTNPFPVDPPKFIRANLYRYNFSGFDELFRSGQWWRREYKGQFLPVVSGAIAPSK